MTHLTPQPGDHLQPKAGDTITHRRHTHRRLTVLEVLPAGQLVVRNSRAKKTYTITRPEEWVVVERAHTGLQTQPLPGVDVEDPRKVGDADPRVAGTDPADPDQESAPTKGAP